MLNHQRLIVSETPQTLIITNLRKGSSEIDFVVNAMDCRDELDLKHQRILNPLNLQAMIVYFEVSICLANSHKTN